MCIKMYFLIIKVAKHLKKKCDIANSNTTVRASSNKKKPKDGDEKEV